MQEKYMPEGAGISSARNRELTSGLQGLEYAHSEKLTLEGLVTKCDRSGALTVELGTFTGIIPRSEVQMTVGDLPVRDIAVITRVGKAVAVKITEIRQEERGVTVLLSRRLAQEECYGDYISRLVPGDVIDAKITHIEPFGAFCDIGCGIVSLLSVDCISVSRIRSPADRFFVGQYIRAVVKSGADEYGRITLSHKELLGTWQENADRFSPGETAAGIVRSIEPYGIFVELAPNLAGLAEWRGGITEGQSAAVYIKSILPEKMKVKLVIVDTQNVEMPFQVPQYFFEGEHIGHWRYSPPSSEKLIETRFDGE